MCWHSYRLAGESQRDQKADDYARDLITESITLFEVIGGSKKVAEARTELAYCYWRSGANDEARILISEALRRLTTEGNTRANALIGLSVVEWSESRYNEALKILSENAPLFKKITSHELEITEGTFGSVFSNAQRERMSLHIEELRRLTSQESLMETHTGDQSE